MANRYRPVPWNLRKRRRPQDIPGITEFQSLTDGTTIKYQEQPTGDDLSDWLDKNWSDTPQPKPKPKGLGDARYYVSATSGATAWNPSFEGFGVFDAQNHEYCVYASYALGNAERRCKLMNDVDQGLRQRYEVVEDQRQGWYHVIDIYHPMKWAWSGRKEECEEQAQLLNRRKT